ncbi:helix-turn-helix domain-containing protein [Nitratireductor sp. GCM10026969]|uniref:helix-turn-helix domain-containing protein n=1 Tax=Nitratireductor sp. GCM10026969 TaxID=3252645 RepID=UPI00361106C7
MDAYKKRMGLVETADPDIAKPVYRRPSFDGVRTLGEMEQRIADHLRGKRKEKALSREELAELLGLSAQVYGRYERAFSKMHVTRMIHLCEVLGLMPMEMLFDAAPHIWGRTPEEAEDRLALAKLVVGLPHAVTKDLLRIVEHLSQDEEQQRAEQMRQAPRRMAGRG